jgi:hypothetical protein
MADFTSIIEDLIRSQVGKAAKYRVYDRQIRNPMNFVLDEAEKQAKKKFTVYWVDGGVPENFSLIGLDPTPVVFNRRFLEIASFLRKIIAESSFSHDIRSELSERLCLRLISELSLSYGDPEFAALSFVKSIIEQSVYVPTADVLSELELSPINEAYMANWFFGLTHEIGHMVSDDRKGSFSDELLQVIFEEGLNKFSAFPEELKREARERFKQSGSRLSIDNIRLEAISDIHAISILLVATLNIMREAGNAVRYEHFIMAVIIFINVLIIFQRCSDIAKIVSHSRSDRDTNLEMVLAPLSFYVRSSIAMWYLERAFYYGADFNLLSRKELDQIIDKNRNLISAITDSLKQAVNAVEVGLARAMRFALFPNEREPDLMSKFLDEISDPLSQIMVKMEGKAFCEKAESLGLISEEIQALRRTVGLKEIDLVYTIPWIKGPGHIDRPLDLKTKYGSLVFVFQTQGELYKTFFNSSSKGLADGYSLQTAAVVVRSQEQLLKQIAERMPSGPFGVVFEGTSDFRQIMEELVQEKNFKFDNDENHVTKRSPI